MTLTAYEINSGRLDKPDPPYEPKAMVSYRLIFTFPSIDVLYVCFTLRSQCSGGWDGRRFRNKLTVVYELIN